MRVALADAMAERVSVDALAVPVALGEPLVGPAVGEFSSNPAGSNFCTAASGALKVKAVRTLRSVADSLSSATAGEIASTKAAIKR